MKETKPVTVIVRLTKRQARTLSALSQGTTKSAALRQLLTQAAEVIQATKGHQRESEAYHE